jgi:hypothetical protein
MQIAVGVGYDRIGVKQGKSEISIGTDNIMYRTSKYGRITDIN